LIIKNVKITAYNPIKTKIRFTNGDLNGIIYITKVDKRRKIL